MPTFSATITTLGAQRLTEAQYAGVPLVFTEFAVGDGSGSMPTVDPDRTELVNEVYRGTVNGTTISANARSTVVVEGIIPSGSGQFTVREVGLFNAANELIAYASHPDTYKPIPAEGVTAQMRIAVPLYYAAIEAVEITTDPNIITATREYVEDMTAGGLWLAENFS